MCHERAERINGPDAARRDDAGAALHRLAVIGHPIDHSLSPQIHACFAERMGLSVDYQRLDVLPDTLEAFLDRARRSGISGFNVTMPLKAEILPHLTERDESVRRYGACNTVARRGDGWMGYNTDGEGFRLSLTREGFTIRGADALILGAGGAARAVALALLDGGARVTMACRSPEKVGGFARAAVAPWEKLIEAARGKALVVNATPLGMRGVAGTFTDFDFLDELKDGAWVCDLIYAPRETHLLQAARGRGLQAMNGLAHLVCQAAFSFGYFTGRMPADDAIDAAMRMLAD